MPTYEYRCEKCGEEFSRIITIKEYETLKVTCPKCNSPEVKQQMSKFVAKTSSKT
jgi:putative FmdB family regulatory protein